MTGNLFFAAVITGCVADLALYIAGSGYGPFAFAAAMCLFYVFLAARKIIMGGKK